MMARRAAGDELATIDEAVAFEGIGGDDPTPGTKPRRTRRATNTGNRGRIPARTAGGKIKSKAEKVAEVHAQLYTVMGLGAALWASRDEECASSATPERIDAMAEGFTSLIARHPTALDYAASSGIIGDVFKILAAAVPIVTTVFRAHGPGGHGHQSEESAHDIDRFAPYVGQPA
jgi:hypothetical protein